MPTSVDLSGKNVLITGGTRGIGAAVADLFEQAGASLLITGTNVDDVARRNEDGRGTAREYIQVDFADSRSTEEFCAAVAKRRVDVLVNNAGVNRIAPLEKITAADYEWLMSINLRAPLLVAQAVSPGMRDRKWGRIVNVASIWSVITKPGRALYTTAKSGLAGMTRVLAAEMAADGVLVNTISPGFTRTELTASTLSVTAIRELTAAVPASRFAEPSEIANVVLFLGSDMNTYLTGQNIVVDGGFTIV